MSIHTIIIIIIVYVYILCIDCPYPDAMIALSQQDDLVFLLEVLATHSALRQLHKNTPIRYIATRKSSCGVVVLIQKLCLQDRSLNRTLHRKVACNIDSQNATTFNPGV